MKRAIAASVALAAALALEPAAVRADVKLDVRAEPTSLSTDDRLTVQIAVQSRGMGSPRIELPEFDGFQVLSQQVQRPMQFSFSFGAQATVQSSTIYTFVLQPLRVGKITIKPVRVELDNEVKTSQPIAIAVAAGSGQPAPDPDPTPDDPDEPAASPATNPSAMLDSAEVDPIAFVRAVVDKAEPYQGEQVTLTLYLYVRDRLQSSPSIETEPTTDGLWVHDLLPPARSLQPGRQLVNGDVYGVYVLRRLAAFPLHAGDVTIGPMTVEIDTSSAFDIFAPGRARSKLVRSGKPLTLHVKPLPAEGKPPGQVAVGKYQIAAKLDRPQAVTGDAVTLTATVQGQGNIRDVTLALPKLRGFDTLQPELKDLVSSPDDLVNGTRELRWLLVPREPGTFTIPALELATFDPATQKYARLKTEPLKLEVVGPSLASKQGAADSAGDAQAAADDAAPGEKHVWAPIRTQSNLQRGYARLSEQPGYRWALLAPGLLWISVLGASALRRRSEARASAGQGRALRQAEQRLHNAESAAKSGDNSRFHAEAGAALIAVLEARLGEPLSGFTRQQLTQRLGERGLPKPLLDELIRSLERAEFARFSAPSPSASADLSAQAKGVRELYGRLASFAPEASAEAV